MFIGHARIVIVIALLLVALFAAILFHSLHPGTSVDSSSPALVLARDGEAGKIVDAVEAIVRPRQAAAAICEKAGNRFICVAVEGPGPEKYFQLDLDLTGDQFPSLKELKFAAPPFQISRSMSVYRSEAKRISNYNERTDRLLVLICPRSEWAQLHIVCPELKVPMPHVPSAPAGDPNAKDRF